MSEVFGKGIIRVIDESTATFPVLQGEIAKINSNLDDIRTNALSDTSKLFSLIKPDEDQTLPVSANGYQLAGAIQAASPGALTLTLPDSANLTIPYRVRLFDLSENATTYDLTLNPNTSQTFLNRPSGSPGDPVVITVDGGFVDVVYTDADTWYILDCKLT